MGLGRPVSGHDMDDFLKALADRYEGWEIVEILRIPSEEVIEAFKDLVLDNENDLREMINYE